MKQFLKKIFGYFYKHECKHEYEAVESSNIRFEQCDVDRVVSYFIDNLRPDRE